MDRRTFLATTAAASAAGILSGGTSSSPVVDAYSACVELDALQAGGIDVVVQALTAEELLVSIPSANPVPGEDVWEHVFEGSNAVKRLLQDLDQQTAFIEQNQNRIERAKDARDILRVTASGRIALIMMLKSGWINEDLAVLRKFRQLGVRVMALCHQAAFAWSDSTAELNLKPGLTDFGRSVVRECNRIGVVVDLAHSSGRTAHDALDTSTRPVIVSHTKCRALSNSPRDVDDALMRRVAKSGGIVGILAARPRTTEERLQARLERDRRLKRTHTDPFAIGAGQRAEALIAPTTLDIEHIGHAVQLIGIDQVALASHCTDAREWATFRTALKKYGYSEGDVTKILGGNMIRFFQSTIGTL